MKLQPYFTTDKISFMFCTSKKIECDMSRFNKQFHKKAIASLFRQTQADSSVVVYTTFQYTFLTRVKMGHSGRLFAKQHLVVQQVSRVHIFESAEHTSFNFNFMKQCLRHYSVIVSWAQYTNVTFN